MIRIETIPQNLNPAEIQQIDIQFNQIAGAFGAEALNSYQRIANQYDGEEDEFETEDGLTIIRSNN